MFVASVLVGLPVMLVCLVLQLVTAFLSVRHYVRRAPRGPSGVVAGVRPLLEAMLILMLGNVVEIVVWALLFQSFGEFDQLFDAIYHSAVNFTSLGYGDVVMSNRWKLLGPLEALNGIVMLGITSAALMAMLQQLIRAQRGELPLR